MDFLLFPGGVIGLAVCLFLYLSKQKTAQRAIGVAKAHLTSSEDIAAGYASVEASVKRLRAAKTEENALHAQMWEKQFYSPDEYAKILDERRHGKALTEHRSNTRYISAGKITADKIVTGAKFFQGDKQILVDDSPEWMPLGHSGTDPDTEMSYSQRRVQSAGAFVREAPNTSAKTYGVAEGGSVLRFDGYVRGQAVGGNNVWFVYIGKNSKLPKFVHSIATTNRSTSGLPDLTEYDTETIYNAAGDVCATYKTHPTGGIVIGSEYLQLPNATIRSRQAENMPKKKYNPVPKDEIPPTITQVYK